MCDQSSSSSEETSISEFSQRRITIFETLGVDKQPTPRQLPRYRLKYAEIFEKKKNSPNLELLKCHLSDEGRLETASVMKIMKQTKQLLKSEDNVLYIEEPLIMVGDIHGQFYDLLRLLDIGGPLDEDTSRQYLFLGDYVDRGMFGIECMLVLCVMKIGFPKRMFMLRGNHECRHLTAFFSFKLECLAKYNEKVYDACMDLFDCLPLAAIVNNQFFCVHGGLSPRIQTIEDVHEIDRFQEPCKHGDAMTDILWSDPAKDYGSSDGLVSDYFSFNQSRKVSFYYSYSAVCDFLKDNDLLSVIRAHEAKDTGYQMYQKSTFSKFPSLITIFSAPNYCDTYGNKGVILSYADGSLNIKTFTERVHPYWLPNFQDGITWSLPFAAKMVTQMLLAICTICTDEELEESDESDDEARTSSATIKNKVKAIGKMGRYYNMVSENNGIVAQLKGLSGDEKLPAGTLSRSRGSLELELLSQQKRLSFDQAVNFDEANEAMPSGKIKQESFPFTEDEDTSNSDSKMSEPPK